jgi:hypothetical protein
MQTALVHMRVLGVGVIVVMACFFVVVLIGATAAA